MIGGFCVPGSFFHPGDAWPESASIPLVFPGDRGVMKIKTLLIINLFAALAAAGAAHVYPDTINGGFAGGEVSFVSFRKVL